MQESAGAESWSANGTSGGITRDTTADGSPGCRGAGRVPFPRAAIRDAILDLERKGDIDAQVRHGATSTLCGGTLLAAQGPLHCHSPTLFHT